MPWTPELEAASIVLAGAFNPSIFHPVWFATQGLLREDEAKAAQEAEGHLQLIHPHLCSFTADWLTLQVTSDRFSATATGPAHYSALRDLVLGTFTVLEHTGFDKMGLNRDLHFRMESEEKWHAVGDALAPKQYWASLLKGRPGLRTLLVEGLRFEEQNVMLRVKVEPSTKVKPGVYIGTNEHHEAATARALLDALKDSWEESQRYAEFVANHLLSETLLA